MSQPPKLTPFSVNFTEGFVLSTIPPSDTCKYADNVSEELWKAPLETASIAKIVKE